ncbi:hypothetical protein VHA_001178 [Grimontia hollisae CIP 101886]|uniref:Uncharacterized protein n=1 Tax=Grimontia hollisae CIP 101886 TaxID=675812 RepID=D0I611_GRIHO|nr:hypothetical protein VHA_001178 [Grimontia hollisae CIP 101886]STQ75978.1 Uncharacterised protein [Grimontia hollisae]
MPVLKLSAKYFDILTIIHSSLLTDKRKRPMYDTGLWIEM